MILATIGIIIQLIFLEGILSIDNAAVLGTMAATLPDDIKIPWPKALHPLGKFLQPVLGNQRTASLRVGLLGAYLMRGLMLTVASLVIQNRWFKLIGAFYLVKLAFTNLGKPESGEEEQFEETHRPLGFWMTVVNVELADLIFSIDNVVAAVSLSKKLWVVMVGVAIGILAMRFAAGLFTRAVIKEPVLKSAAYILVLNIGIQLFFEEFSHQGINDFVRLGISLGIILFTLLYAHSKLLQKLRPVLDWLAEGMDSLNEVINWALEPIAWVLRSIVGVIKHLFRKDPAPAEGE